MEHVVLEIGLALAIMAVAGFVATRLHLPTVPLLILAGMAVGPHLPQLGILDFRFENSGPLIQFMGRIGVLFLLFYLGLEFSLSRLIQAGRSILIGGTIYITLNFTLALLYGWSMGWPFKETLAVAGIMTITSTAIVAKVLVDLKRTANPETEMILGMIMFDDVFLAVFLAVFSGLVLSGATSLGGVFLAGGTAVGFIVAFLALGRLARPWLNRLLDIASADVFLLVVFTALFLIAGLGETVHVAEAVCALLLGLVLADTEHRQRIEHLIVPFRDLFGSVFFFSFGLSLDPRTLGGAVGPALIAVLITLVGNFVAGMLAGRTAGLSPKAATNIGVTITARGELSIVVANVAKAGGLAAGLQSFAALYVFILAILGPILTRESRVIYKALNAVFKWEKPKAPGGAAATASRQGISAGAGRQGTPVSGQQHGAGAPGGPGAPAASEQDREVAASGHNESG